MQKLNRRGIVFFVVGLVLLITSFFPMYLMIREVLLENYIDSKYEVEEAINVRNRTELGQPIRPSYIFASGIQLEGNTIEVLTENTGINSPKTVLDNRLKSIMKMIIKINGKVISFPSDAWLLPNDTTDSRFLSWLNIVKIKDKKVHDEEIAIVQRISGDWVVGENIYTHNQSQKWRILYINKKHEVKEESFSYPERGKHLLGVKLVKLSSQSSSLIGYKSDILTYYPTIFFPITYPIFTFVLGIILLVIGMIRFRLKNNK